MFKYIENVVFWLNHGCKVLQNGKEVYIVPCPSSKICGLISPVDTPNDTFCPKDPHVVVTLLEEPFLADVINISE